MEEATAAALRSERARAAARARWGEGYQRKSRVSPAVRSDDGSTPNRVTCAECGQTLTGKQRRFCSKRCSDFSYGNRKHPTERNCPVCGEHFEAANNKRFCSRRCKRRFENERYQSQTETVTCEGCGSYFDRARGRKRHVYCSDECHASAKRERYEQRCEHGVTSNGRGCPACTFIERAERGTGWRRVVKTDRCAYCGERGGSVDHIDPHLADRLDPANWTGACNRCNALKKQLPLLVALVWIPVGRRYHDLRRELFAVA